MSQTLDEKAAAIASVLWLLPEHYTMIRLNRNGSIAYINELEQSDGWHPPAMPEFEDWPLEDLLRWFSYQRHLSAKYRLWPVGLALQKLERKRSEEAMAVVMECVESGEFTWYEPERVSVRCRAGLRFMAEHVSGDVPFFQEAAVDYRRPTLSKVARNRRIVEMEAEGIGKKKIARELRCSLSTIKAVLSGLVVRRGRTVSATGVDK